MSDPWNNIPGNASNYPANIRAVGGGENRTSAIMDREISDLADRTAWLKAKAASLDAVDAQLGYQQVGTAFSFIATSAANVTSSSKTPTAFTPNLSATIDGLLVGDYVTIIVGPIVSFCDHYSNGLGLLTTIWEGSTEKVQYFSPGGGATDHPLMLTLPFEYLVSAGTPSSPTTLHVTCYAVADGTNSITLSVGGLSPGTWDDGAGVFTPANYHWGLGRVLRAVTL